MSVHSILAVLMGSTALSQYDELMLNWAARHFTIGVPIGRVAALTVIQDIVIGLRPGYLLLDEGRQHIIPGLWDEVMPIEVHQKILISRAAWLPNSVTVEKALLHTIVNTG